MDVNEEEYRKLLTTRLEDLHDIKAHSKFVVSRKYEEGDWFQNSDLRIFQCLGEVHPGVYHWTEVDYEKCGLPERRRVDPPTSGSHVGNYVSEEYKSAFANEAFMAWKQHAVTADPDWTPGGPNYLAWWEKYSELEKTYRETRGIIETIETIDRTDPPMEEKWIEAEGPQTMQEYLKQERDAGRLIRLSERRQWTRGSQDNLSNLNPRMGQI